MPRLRGPLRADRRTKNLAARLRPGDVALIRHADLDAMAARSLIERRVAAVINASPSITGRYPNLGPRLLIDAGIPIVDAIGDAFFDAAAERQGQQVTIDDGVVTVPGLPPATGALLTAALADEQLERARGNLSAELDAFARNTLEYLAQEKPLILDPVELPDLGTRFRDRHALVVVRGEGYREDLRAIETYLRDVRPVLIGVDGGADALLEVGLTPDIVIGDMDSVSDQALRQCREIVVHGYARGGREAPGLARVETLGLKAIVFHAQGTSEDIAMLIANEMGASLVVAVGTHFSLIDFLDKGRGGMASTFLVRLRVGSKLVDAKGIGRLWSQRSRPMTRDILLLIAAALFPLGIIVAQSPLLRATLETIRLSLRSAFHLH